MESRILSACLRSRGDYETVIRAFGEDGFTASLSTVAKATAELLEDFYSTDPDAQTCSREVLLDRAQKKAYNPHHVKAIEDFCRGLDGTISVPNLVRDIRDHRRHRVGDAIAGLLANRTEGRELDQLIDKYQSLKEDDSDESSSEEEVYCGVSLGDLLSAGNSKGSTIPFGLPRLNDLTGGGARPGHHILVYARPELGKSLLCIDEVSSWIKRNYRVVYIENEEPLFDTTMRLIGRICRRTRDEIRANPVKAQGVLDISGYDNFTGVSLSPGNFPAIRKLVDEHKPHIVVINQLRNIDVGDDNRVTALEKAAVGARNLAKSRGVVVLSVTQAGESAEGKQFLELSDIDFSKTGIPGAIDLAIAIGASQEDKRFGFRTINLPKNKLGGEHGSFQVKVFPQTGVIEQV